MKKPTLEEAQACLTPEFSAAMHKYMEAAEKYGEDSEEARDLFLVAMLIAPQAFTEHMNQIADEVDLLPESDGYLEDGTPMISAESLVKHLGVSETEVIEGMQKINAKRVELGLSEGLIVTDSSRISRKQ